ncbi:MAG: DMT family transporter [Candidatus Hermodarchaeota archaeon]
MIKIYLQLVSLVIIWGFSFVVVDIAVEIIPPLSIAFYRFLIASLTFIIIDIFLKITKKTEFIENGEKKQKYTKKDFILLLLASFSGVSLFFFAQYSAIEIIGPSLPALFVCLLAPVIITILALIFFKETLNLRKVIGFLIASVGGFLLITGGDLNTLTPKDPNFLGYLFALSTALLWAFYSTITKKIGNINSNFVMLKYIAYLGTIELFFFVLLNNELSTFISNMINVVLILCVIYVGILCYILGYYIWQNSQLSLKSSKVASFLYVEPFITLLFSILLKRSETIIIWNILGGIVVLFAVLLINYK